MLARSSEAEIIKGCREHNESAQRALYDRFSPVMRAVCLRYTSSPEEAKDIMQEGFIKVFKHLSSFKGEGSLEGWMKRIMINTAISYFKKNKKLQFQKLDEINFTENGNIQTFPESMYETPDDDDALDQPFSTDQLMAALMRLPEPFRLVFNMFYIEEFGHKEIAEALSIDENTSRSRLHRAKKLLKNYLTEKVVITK